MFSFPSLLSPIILISYLSSPHLPPPSSISPSLSPLYPIPIPLLYSYLSSPPPPLPLLPLPLLLLLRSVNSVRLVAYLSVCTCVQRQTDSFSFSSFLSSGFVNATIKRCRFYFFTLLVFFFFRGFYSAPKSELY